jgi:hypothetical protein
MTMSRGGHAELISPIYTKVWADEFKEQTNIGKMLVNVQKAPKRGYVDELDYATLGAAVVKPEGGAVTYVDATPGSAKRYLFDVYGLGFRVTEEMYDDELYGVFGSKMTKALARSIRNNIELVQHAPYNNAFSTSYVGFRAGESLCSTSHTYISGTAASNRNDVDFNLLALQAALEHFETLTEESGMPAMFEPDFVLHTPGDQWAVEQVLKAQYLPGTNQNDPNVVATRGLRPIKSRFLSDADSWFVVCKEHDVNYKERKAASFTSQDDFDTGDSKHRGTVRHTSGFGKWQGVWGSAGA